MPMRVSDEQPAAPAPGDGGGGESPEEQAKKKKGDGDGVVGDAVEAAGWGCAIFSCLDCLSTLALGAAATAVLVRRSRRRRIAASLGES